MKRIVLSRYNRVIAFLLSILGIGSACTFGGCEYGSPAVEYGTPHAVFEVFGKVTGDNDVAVPAVRVSLEYDTTYTDENGNYIARVTAFPEDQNLTMEFMDIDGELNGSYPPADTVASFVDPEFKNGDGSWYSGKVSTELNIKLTPGNK